MPLPRIDLIGANIIEITDIKPNFNSLFNASISETAKMVITATATFKTQAKTELKAAIEKNKVTQIKPEIMRFGKMIT
jgi:pyruvate/2-oxoglutarate/acetoin dehydrogenase E1 component